MSSQSSVVLRQYDKQTLKHVDIISGISPNAMRRVFGGWILFVAIVAVIVSVAPDLSVQFIGLTLFVLVAFTLLMFGQSRISEGWPAIPFSLYFFFLAGAIRGKSADRNAGSVRQKVGDSTQTAPYLKSSVQN